MHSSESERVYKKILKHIKMKTEKIFIKFFLSSISVKQNRHATPAYCPFLEQLKFIHTEADESNYIPQRIHHNAYTCHIVLVVHMYRVQTVLENYLKMKCPWKLLQNSLKFRCPWKLSLNLKCPWKVLEFWISDLLFQTRETQHCNL